VEPDGIWGGGVYYPGKPYCTGAEAVISAIKPKPRRRTRNGEGAEGGRSTGSTCDSGPMKPGNRVEDKTLTIRERRIGEDQDGDPAIYDG